MLAKKIKDSMRSAERVMKNMGMKMQEKKKEMGAERNEKMMMYERDMGPEMMKKMQRKTKKY